MLTVAYAMGGGGQAAGQPNPIILFVFIFLIFYFVLIRPQQKTQQKKEQEHRDMLKNLKKNDEVITTGGIHGTVVNVKEKTVILRVDDNCRIEVQKESISFLEKEKD